MVLFLTVEMPACVGSFSLSEKVPDGWRTHNVKITSRATTMPNTSVSSLYVNLLIMVSIAWTKAVPFVKKLVFQPENEFLGTSMFTLEH